MQVLSCWQFHVHNLQIHKVFLQKLSFIWHQKVAMNFPNRISILLWEVIFLICKRRVLSLVKCCLSFPKPKEAPSDDTSKTKELSEFCFPNPLYPCKSFSTYCNSSGCSTPCGIFWLKHPCLPIDFIKGIPEFLQWLQCCQELVVNVY